jgi:ATP-dependent metalloprotease
MDGFEKADNVLVIGATNHEDALDPAAVRPGRFDKKIHVPLPDVNGREDIFNFYLGSITKGIDI